MELELGLKITHTRDDDITSTADLRIIKDPFGPVFLSRETDQMFILIAHLKGFRRENIFIEINKDGDRIAISGEKPVQEMVMIGWIMCKKEVEIKSFRKIFRIPEAVDLERIKAKYNEQESTLRIIMKKKFKGICGVGIEEEKEEEEEEEEEEEPKMINEEVPKEDVIEKMEAEEARKEYVVEKKGAEEAPKEDVVEKKEAEEVPKVELVDKKEPAKEPKDKFIEKKEPEAEKVPKLELVRKKEPGILVEKKEPEEVPKDEIVEEKIQSTQEPEPVVKEGSFQTEPEESESEKGDEIEELIEKEEPEEEGNAIHGEPGKVEEVMQKEPEEPELETVEETDQVLETPKKIPEEKFAATPATQRSSSPEPETMKPEVVEPQMTEMPSIKEPEEKEPPDEIQKVPELEGEEWEEETEDEVGRAPQQAQLPSLPPSQEEDGKIANEDDQAEDLTSEQSEGQESGAGVLEFKMEPEPDTEPKEETSTQQQLEDESDKQEPDHEEETENIEGEIEEVNDQEEHGRENEGDMDISPEIDADKCPIEGPAIKEEPKRTKLRKPIMFAGSAFLVSLIVLVINLLRVRKR